jgi:hypothetical protein
MRILLSVTIAISLIATSALGSVVVREHKVGGKPVVVIQPAGPGPWPVVYALSGLGEMVRGPRAAAWGWVEKYGLVPAARAVTSKRLTSKAFHGLVTGKLLDAYRARHARGYAGLVIVCPAVPRKLTRAFKTYLLKRLIPWAESTLPIKRGPRFRGIDGISLGARHALRIGFEYPEKFRTLGTEQAAANGLAGYLTGRVRKAPQSFRNLVVNLLTSRGDGYRKVVGRLARALKGVGLHVRYGVTPGGHNKRFAKGPGAIDMLLFHDGVLNGTARLTTSYP